MKAVEAATRASSLSRLVGRLEPRTPSGDARLRSCRSTPTLGLLVVHCKGRRSRHYETQSFQRLPPDCSDTTDGCGPDGAAGGWASPPLPPGPQDSMGTAAGRMEQREEEARVIPRQADDTTTRPLGSGPTSESDARDSERTFEV